MSHLDGNVRSKSGKTTISIWLPSLSIQQVLIRGLGYLSRMFALIDQVFAHKAMVVICAVLGITIGCTVVVAGQPRLVTASQDQLDQFAQVQPVRLSIAETSLPVYEQVDRNQVLQVYAQPVRGFNSLDFSQRALVLKVSLAGANRLKNLALGTEIVVEGSNNGRYVFQVTAVKYDHLDEVFAGVNLDQAGLVLFAPTGIISDEQVVVVAR